MADHRTTILRLYEAFGRGDLEAILGAVADDVDWGLPPGSPVLELAPFFATSRTPAQVGERYFGGIVATFDFEAFEPQAVAVDGPHVVSVIHEVLTVRRTGRRIDADAVHHFTFGDDGRIVRYRPIVDSAAFLRAL